VTTLAPLPGRNTEPEDRGGDEAAGAPVGSPDPVDLTGHEPEPPDTVDLTGRRPEPPTDVAGQATWLFGLALALLTEGTSEDVVMAEVLAEAAGRSRALEGAYGRAVALLSEFPGDPLVHRTVDLMAKALLRSRRPARAAEEA
jgi:hypothetical protein